MKCRECKKEYESDEWKITGNNNGICSRKCRIAHNKRCRPSHLNNLVREMKS